MGTTHRKSPSHKTNTMIKAETATTIMTMIVIHPPQVTPTTHVMMVILVWRSMIAKKAQSKMITQGAEVRVLLVEQSEVMMKAKIEIPHTKAKKCLFLQAIPPS